MAILKTRRKMLLTAKVIPSSKKAEVVKSKNVILLFSVGAAALGGRANKEALKLLAEHLGLKPGKLRLVSGGHKPAKIFEVTN